MIILTVIVCLFCAILFCVCRVTAPDYVVDICRFTGPDYAVGIGRVTAPDYVVGLFNFSAHMLRKEKEVLLH
jgi:hypothetical protein